MGNISSNLSDEQLTKFSESIFFTKNEVAKLYKRYEKLGVVVYKNQLKLMI